MYYQYAISNHQSMQPLTNNHKNKKTNKQTTQQSLITKNITQFGTTIKTSNVDVLM